MGSPFEGVVLDPVKCSKMSMEERREIVYELANWSHGAPEMLQSWSRQDILQILCSEMGKERKYTGLTKLKIIEHLLKVVSEKRLGSNKSGGFEPQSSPAVTHKALKRARKSDHPTHLPIPVTDLSTMSNDDDVDTAAFCKNTACKAKLSRKDQFCKRCSCCICHKYDDNKDPSLWLTCSSEPPFLGDSCNVSCHLECAFKHVRSGIATNGLIAQLDGSFYCVSCGKMNDIMRCWRKQIIIAKDTRRVDILCFRLSLSQKLLAGSKKYREISELVDEAVKQLEAEVGNLAGVSARTIGRGIVTRLSSGQRVQELCASAVASFDSMVSCRVLHQESKLLAPNVIRIEEISPTSVTLILGPDTTPESNVSYALWHHKADEKEMTQPTCTLVPSKTRFTVSRLSPGTEYVLRVVAVIDTQELSSSEVRVTTNISTDNVFECPTLERSQSPQTNCSSLSNPSSEEDETNNVTPYSNLNASKDQSDALKSGTNHPPDAQIGEAMSNDSLPNNQGKIDPITNLPITPCRVESLKDGNAKNGGPKSQNKEQDGSGKVDRENAKKLIQEKEVGMPRRGMC